MSFSRLVRFVPKSNPQLVLVGEPEDAHQDVGLATRSGQPVKVRVFSGTSALQPGYATHRVEEIARLLSPISQQEVGTIRCIGLNYRAHAREVKATVPTMPILFMKPATALGDPYPAPTIIPRFTARDDCADYEAELAVVISKPCKNVSESEALDYVLGYTCANDVSSRKLQVAQSQWNYSKGFDTACPLGPVLVSPRLIPDPSKLHIRGYRNGSKVQDSGVDDLIFNVPQLISFLSRGTTLPAGTTIVTGTPAGVGMGTNQFLKDGEEFAVEVLPHIGTLVNIFELEGGRPSL